MKPLHPCVLLIGSLLAVGLAYAEGAAGVHHDENAMAAARARLRTHMGSRSAFDGPGASDLPLDGTVLR